MRRDRDGSLIEAENDQDESHACRNGWTGYDPDGRPTPCLICRPHLRRVDTGTGTTWILRRTPR